MVYSPYSSSFVDTIVNPPAWICSRRPLGLVPLYLCPLPLENESLTDT